MIRIGMLSFWHLHGADYARAAQEHPDTEIVAVWDEDPVRGAAEAEHLGVRFHAGLDELLAREDVDAVVVDAPTNAHREVIIAAVRAGKHVFTEKVIAATLREADEIIAEAERAGIAFMVSMWRSDEPYAAAIREVIDTGELGRITELRIRDGHPLGLPTADHPDGVLPPHFWDPVTARGGVLIDLCHPAYLVPMLLGLPEEVSAVLGFVTGHEVEDNAVVTLRYPDGAIAIAETSSTTAFTPFSIEVHGTEGSLIFTADGIGELVALRRDPAAAASADRGPWAPDHGLRMRTRAGSAWERRELPGGQWPKAFEQWVAHIRAGTTAPENVALGRSLSAVIEAAYISHREGRRIAIAELEHAPAG